MKRLFFLLLLCVLPLAACRCFELPVKRARDKNAPVASGIFESSSMALEWIDSCELYQKQLRCIDKGKERDAELARLNQQELIGVTNTVMNVCVLDIFGKVDCMGRNRAKWLEKTSSFRFDSIKGFMRVFCGHDVDTDLVHCFDVIGKAENFDQQLLSGIKAKDYAAADRDVCIINLDDEIECRPLFTGPSEITLKVPAGKYDRVLASFLTVCGQKGQRVSCQVTPDPNYKTMYLKDLPEIEAKSWKQLSVSSQSICGIDEDDRAHCFGHVRDDPRDKVSLPTEPIAEIAVGGFDVCFRRTAESRMECTRPR